MLEHDHYLSLSLPGVLCPDTEAKVLAVEHCLVKALALYDGGLIRLHHDLDHATILPSNFTGLR